MMLQILATQHPKKVVPTLPYEIIPKSETEKRKRVRMSNHTVEFATYHGHVKPAPRLEPDVDILECTYPSP
jgi:hypothetical protein